MPRTALVTGGSGYIASHLLPVLVADGWEVRTCGRRDRPAGIPAEAEYQRVDLAERPGLDGLLDGITHVFHLAGASSSRSSEEEMWRSNVVATERLVGAAAAAGVERFVHMSSTSVYGEDEQLPLPVREDIQPRPSRAYGKAKWGAEEAVWRAAEKVPAVVLRPVSVFGPGNEKLLA
ncbi:MAG: NAD(P)-dependent oxidoreductase, partial [Acidimicrobiales bacterium]